MIAVALVLALHGCKSEPPSKPSRITPTTNIPGLEGSLPSASPVSSKATSLDTSMDMGWWNTPITRAKCGSPPVVVAPLWERNARTELGPDMVPENTFARQTRTLSMFREAAKHGAWNRINDEHFDWWQFPCDFGSRREFNLKSENDIQRLKSFPDWHKQYLESILVVSRAFGWDIEKQEIMKTGAGSWRPDKDIRLAKMMRSLWLFGEEPYFFSLEKFASLIHNNIYKGGGFEYAGRCYDEILLMTLPRSIPF